MNKKENDVSLPFAALQLLAPPMRLVSAAFWKVLKQRDVMQYGVLEEFVTSACESVPGLLTSRHQAKLALGFRARLILELCSKQPDVQVIQPHLERIKPPAASLSSSTLRKDVKITRTVEHFHSLVHTLLSDAAEREQFFKEEFPVEYGPKFDQELEKLLWEFLIRLDQLLPSPSLSQTVSWLSNAPPVLEECAQAATQPQLLEILLHHQSCLGHLETAASLPPNMGDTILASLSLPLSGKVLSKQPTETGRSLSKQVETQKEPLVQPVFGLTSNDDGPAITAASKRDPHGEKTTNQSIKFTSIKQKSKVDEEEPGPNRSTCMKRKQADKANSDSDSEMDDALRLRKRRLNAQEKNLDKGTLRTCSVQLRRGQSLATIVASCLSKQAQVVLKRLTLDSVQADATGSSKPGWKSPIKRTRGLQQPDPHDKENRPVKTTGSSTPQQGATGDGGDYVADSEDEATKNFKGRLFVKRYYKTRHGTFIPTLREFWKPRINQQDH